MGNKSGVKARRQLIKRHIFMPFPFARFTGLSIKMRTAKLCTMKESVIAAVDAFSKVFKGIRIRQIKAYSEN